MCELATTWEGARGDVSAPDGRPGEQKTSCEQSEREDSESSERDEGEQVGRGSASDFIPLDR